MNMLNILKNVWSGPDAKIETNVSPKDTTISPNADPRSAATSSVSTSNVIALPIPNLSVSPFHPATAASLEPAPISFRFKGLLNTPELEAFFQENFYHRGRHSGSKFRTQEVLQQDKQSITSQFQNTLTELIERKQEKMNKLRSELIAIEGVSNSMSAQLRLACDQLQRDINLLLGQIEAASAGKGWILESLQRYHIGFTKGLREAIDFELLAG